MGYGIYLSLGTDHNRVINNAINKSKDVGIIISIADFNILTENTISDNGHGIKTVDSGNNTIYHNNFINNTIQAYDNDPSNNYWHHPTLLEGNYWSDYTGIDDGSGTGKHAIARDGIGDTLIPHPLEDYDFYPFINPNGWIKIAATIDIRPGTLNLNSHGMWITAYIELPDGYDVADINISTVLINDTIPAKSHQSDIGDYDKDGIPDIMVKFDRRDTMELVKALSLNLPADVELIVTGTLTDGMSFKGSDTIKVLEKGKHKNKKHMRQKRGR